MKDLLVVLLLLLFTVPAVRELFVPGGFTSHDLTHHVLRQISMDKLLSEGQFPPRWSGELNNGFGYPVFLFNYPLPALTGEVFHKIGLDFVDSVKAVLVLSFFTSGVGMYLFLKALANSKLAAFLGSIFYIYAPIRFLIVYVSGTAGFALGAALVPFLFWAITKLSQNTSFWYILAGSLSLVALITAHNVTTIIFTPAVLGLSGLMVWRSKERLATSRNLGMMFLLGLGLSAWFWLPATFEKSLLRYDEVMGRFWADQYPTFDQLIRSPWGYGFAKPKGEPDGISFQIGLIHLAILVCSMGYLVYRRKSKDLDLWLFSIGAFFLSIFLMLEISLPLWDYIPFLGFVQFPYRFLILSVFASSLTVALLIKWLPWKWPIFILLLFLVIYANRNHWRINETFNPPEEYYLTQKPTTSTYGEHLPKWGKIASREAQGKLEIVGGAGKVAITKDYSDEVEGAVEVKEEAILRLNQYYFPGWVVEVDGKEVKINYLVDGESYGLQLFDIGLGRHLVEAKFINTPIRNLADSISLISLIICGTMILWKLLPQSLLKIKKSS